MLMQATTTRRAVDGVEAEAMLLLVAMAATVVTTMVTMPTEETTTAVATVAMVALPEATMAMVAREATLLVVSVFSAMRFECQWAAAMTGFMHMCLLQKFSCIEFDKQMLKFMTLRLKLCIGAGQQLYCNS